MLRSLRVEILDESCKPARRHIYHTVSCRHSLSLWREQLSVEPRGPHSQIHEPTDVDRERNVCH